MEEQYTIRIYTGCILKPGANVLVADNIPLIVGLWECLGHLKGVFQVTDMVDVNLGVQEQ